MNIYEFIRQIYNAGIAQLVEQLICNHQVPSSNLGAGTTYQIDIINISEIELSIINIVIIINQ